MGHFKSFMLGIGVAFGAYYITRKDNKGKSLLNELLDNPRDFINKTKDYAIEQAIQKVEEKIGQYI